VWWCKKHVLSLNPGTAAAARNVLLSITGCLQLLYRRNTCLGPDEDCIDSTVLQIGNHGQLMSSGHDAAGGLAVEIGAVGSVPIGSSIRVHRERGKGPRRALMLVRPMVGDETCSDAALRCTIRPPLDDRDYADVPESSSVRCCSRRVHNVGERVGEGSLTEDVNVSPLAPKRVQHSVTGCECLATQGPWSRLGRRRAVRRQ
jgi:hypothetical protein